LKTEHAIVKVIDFSFEDQLSTSLSRSTASRNVLLPAGALLKTALAAVAVNSLVNNDPADVELKVGHVEKLLACDVYEEDALESIVLPTVDVAVVAYVAAAAAAATAGE